jgi:quercetin dioxygenase-like cupin family protein
MLIGKIVMALSHFTEKYSERGNEYVLYLGDFDRKSFSLVYMEANKFNKEHYHPNSESTFYFFQGTGKYLLGDKWIEYKPGAFVIVSSGLSHQICPTTDTLFLSTQNPAHRFTDQGWSNTIEK